MAERYFCPLTLHCSIYTGMRKLSKGMFGGDKIREDCILLVGGRYFCSVLQEAKFLDKSKSILQSPVDTKADLSSLVNCIFIDIVNKRA